jgi:PPP family 3-phenylpropionic acid transporter
MGVGQALRQRVSPQVRGAAFYLSIFLSTGVFFPFLNIYYRDLGFSGKQIGILAIFSPIISLIFATPISALADRKHWRIRILQVAIAGQAIFIFLLQFPKNYLMVATILVGMAIISCPVMSFGDSLIARMATRNGLNYGGMRLWGSAGFAVSAAAFGTIWQRFSLAPMFFVASLFLVPLLIIVSSLDEDLPLGLNKHQPMSVIFQDTGMVILVAVSFLMGISNSLSMSFEGILVRYLGGGNNLVGLMAACAASSEITTMLLGQRIAVRLKDAKTLMLGLGLLCIAYSGYVLAPNPGMLVPMAVFRGLGFGLFFSNIVRIVNQRAPEEWVTTAQTLRSVAMFGIATLIAAPLGGLIHDAVSPSAIFVLGSAVLGLAILLVWVAKLKRILE